MEDLDANLVKNVDVTTVDNNKINIQDKALNNKIYTLEFIFSLR